MKKQYFLPAVILFLMLLSGLQPLMAQNVSINSTGAMPDNSAMLDVASTAKGLLIPRVTLASLTDVTTIPTPANSLLVYNSGATVPVGYYYNTGTTTAAVWVKLSTADVLAVTAIGATANANGASISGSNLTLQPADATNGGVVTSGIQTFGGVKTFKDDMTPAGRLMVPMGEINIFSAAGIVFNLPANGLSNGTTNMHLLLPSTPTTLSPDATNFIQLSNGRLKYTGTVPRMFHIACTFSMQPVVGISNQIFVFGIYKNDTTDLVASKVTQKFRDNTDQQSTALHVAVMLAPGDDISLRAGNMTVNGGDITIHTITLFALGM